jgi:divalent metal cation (Fe/Co/Zn/Cd) transporter
MEKKHYRRQAEISIFLLLGEVPNCIIVFLLALSTRSLIVYADLIDSLSLLLRTFCMLFLSKKLRKDLRFEYNYGVGKIEALVSLALDFLLLMSVGLMIFFAITDLIDPQQPSETIGIAVLFKVICVALDFVVFWKQYRLCKQSNSFLLKSELSVRIKSLVFDLISFLALLLVYLFRDNRFIWYFSSIFCIALSIYLITTVVLRMRVAVKEVLDKTADENIQKAVLKTITANYDKYDEFIGIKSRVAGGVVFIELELGFDDNTTVVEVQQLVNDIHELLKDEIPECKVSVNIENK